MPIDAEEQERRRALIKEHYAAENDHDLDRIMDTFADDGVMHPTTFLSKATQGFAVRTSSSE